jgi:hypothetical protein
VVANRVPVSAVLDEIGRQSGTKVIYDGATPRMLVTCDFVGGTPADAFRRALEGLGLNYVLYGGTLARPQSLLVLSSASAPTERAAAAMSPPPAPEVVDGGEEGDSLPLAEPPPDGAAHGRFGRQLDPPAPPSEAGSNAPATGGESGLIQPLQMPSPGQRPPAPAGDQPGRPGPGRRPNRQGSQPN